MATINLTISAADPADFHAALSGLVALFDGGVVPTTEELATARTVLDEIKAESAPATDAPKRGRGRPRKPEAAPEEHPTPSPALAPITPEEAEDAAPVATIGALPPTEPAKEAAEAEEASRPSLTLDDVRAALKALVNAKGGDAARGVLREQGFEKLSDLPEQMYSDVIAKAAAAAV